MLASWSSTTRPPVAVARRSSGSRLAASSMRSGAVAGDDLQPRLGRVSRRAGAGGSGRGHRAGRVRADRKGRGRAPSNVRGWPGTGRRATTATASGRFEFEPARKTRAAIRGAGPTSGTASPIRAWMRTGSPSSRRGLTGPNRTNPFPAASLPAAAQRTTWPQNRWWSRVADAVPPAPGGVGADPEDLAQAVWLRGEDGAGGIAGGGGEDRRPGLGPSREQPGEPGEPGPVPARGVGSGVGVELEHRPGGGVAERGGRSARTDAPGGKAGCAGSSRGGVERTTGRGSSTGRSFRRRVDRPERPPRSAGRG